jgi:hypothetical protein
MASRYAKLAPTSCVTPTPGPLRYAPEVGATCLPVPTMVNKSEDRVPKVARYRLLWVCRKADTETRPAATMPRATPFKRPLVPNSPVTTRCICLYLPRITKSLGSIRLSLRPATRAATTGKFRQRVALKCFGLIGAEPKLRAGTGKYSISTAQRGLGCMGRLLPPNVPTTQPVGCNY